MTGVDPGGLLYDDVRRSELPARGQELCRRLLSCDPHLSLGGDGRAAKALTSSTDTEHHLAALLAANETDWTDWIVNSEPPEPPTTVWDRARLAANRGDAVEVRDILVEAHRRYSPSGRRALDIGILNVLAFRVAKEQSR